MKAFNLAVSLLALASAIPAWAADFSAPITGTESRPFTVCADKTPACQAPVTLGDIAAAALFDTYPDENDPHTGQGLTGEEKFKRASLALKIGAHAKVDLISEETTLVKKLIGKKYAPLIVLRSYEMLDPSMKKPE